MKEKGFTLLELLAVIVILSVITLITVPMVMNVIEESKKKALVSSVQGILDSADYFTMSHEKGVYEFLFDEEHKGSTLKGESLEYKGNIDGEGKLYLDKEGNTSICISNDKYYAYKNYNSGIIVGDKKTGNCIIGFDALTNKYVAMLDNGTGNVSNVYSKDEVNNLVDNLDIKIINNTTEITNIKSNIEELQNNLNDYALQTELDKTNTNIENLSSLTNQNVADINNLKSNFSKNTAWVDLTANINRDNVSSVDEYIRYTISGDLCILDIGGVTFSRIGNGIRWLTLPSEIIPKTRTVSVIARDQIANGSLTSFSMVYNAIGTDGVWAHVSSLNRFYGQMIWKI